MAEDYMDVAIRRIRNNPKILELKRVGNEEYLVGRIRISSNVLHSKNYKTKEVKEILTRQLIKGVDFVFTDTPTTKRGAYKIVDNLDDTYVKTIELYYDPRSVVASKYYDNRLKDETSSDDIIKSLVEQRFTTLVHELTHTLDDLVSKGRAINKTSQDGDHNAYLKLPHEINARYTQVTASKEMKEMKLKSSHPSARAKSLGHGGFENYLDTFKQSFLGWDIMEDKVKKQLTKRLYKEYTTFTNSEKTKIVSGLLSPVAWNFVFDTKNDYKVKSERRFRFNLKKDLTNVLKEFASGKMSPNTLAVEYAGVNNALVELVKETEKFDKMIDELRLSKESKVLLDKASKLKETGW